MTFSVYIEDLHSTKGGPWVIEGFPTLDLAREFARRWVRDSLEEMRKPNQTHEELKTIWSEFGDKASVKLEDGYYEVSSEIDDFIDHPATPEERDWKTIKKKAGIP